MFWASPSPLGSLFQAGNAIARSVSGRGLVDNFVRDSAGLTAGTAVNRIQGLDALSALNDAWANLYNQKRDLIRERVSSLGSDPSTPSIPWINTSKSAKAIDYMNADIAEHYGMNKQTAYNEAMANTAYQRAVADMQSAGLNPASLFSASRASVAGSGYASDSGGSVHSYSSARGASEDGVPGWLFYGISALANIVATGATKNPATGFAASNIAKEVMRAVNGLIK